MFALLSYLAAVVLIVSTLLIGFVSVFETPGATERLQKQAALPKSEQTNSERTNSQQNTAAAQKSASEGVKARIKGAALASVTPATPAEAAPEKDTNRNPPQYAPATNVPPVARKTPPHSRKATQRPRVATHKPYVKPRRAIDDDDGYAQGYSSHEQRGWFAEQLD